ncbi:nucleoside deaminase [Virgibacillus dakarensis]|nr:nucleoside deaminase [Virgibacillus dakarensis]
MVRYMKRAVELAIKNVREGGQPFGAVLVKDKRIAAEGVNTLHKTFDISGHAELQAIRKAQAKLKTNDLSDCSIYASGEPCAMCLTAMYFTGIRKIYYSSSLAEAVANGFEKSEVMTDQNLKQLKDSMIYLPLAGTVDDPVRLWAEGVNK